MTIVKVLLVLLLIFMIFNLFKAMMLMLKDDSSASMSKFIGRRVLTSAVIMALILLALATGLIQPNPRPY